jgi:lipopolysaccharide export system permease protein
MKKLHVLILKSYIGPLVLTFFISMFVLLMQFLWKYIDELVGKGLEISTISELLGYAACGLVPMALPLAILLSSIMTFGNLGENYELTALKSSGISLTRIMYPLIILTILISIGGFFFSNNVLPYTNLKTGSLLYDIRHQRPELNIKEGIFNNDLDNYTIRVGKKDPKTKMMYNFVIYDHSERRGNVSVTLADSAKMYVTKDEKYLVLTLFNGRGYKEIDISKYRGNYKYPHQKSTFREERLIFDMSIFELTRTDDQLFKHNYQMLTLNELQTTEDSLFSQLNTSQTEFKENLIRNNLFRSELKSEVDSILKQRQLAQKDSAITKVNLDSIFTSFTTEQKINTLNLAGNFATSTASYVQSTTDNYLDRLKWIRRHQIEWHKRFALSFACFIFFFIGAPLGAIIRKGGLGTPVVISVFFFIAYYIISLTGDKFARESIIQAYQGMWLSSVILLPLGIFLTYKAAHDSAIMNISYYENFIKSIFNKIFGVRNN